MKDFLTNLSSLYWWISVVIVGVLLNLFSAFLKDRLDNYLSTISAWWRNRSVAQKAQRQKELVRLRDSYHEQTMLAVSELRDRIRSLDMAVFVVTVLVVAVAFNPPNVFKIILFALGSLIFLVAQAVFIGAVNKMRLLFEARRSEKSNEKPKDVNDGAI